MSSVIVSSVEVERANARRFCMFVLAVVGASLGAGLAVAWLDARHDPAAVLLLPLVLVPVVVWKWPQAGLYMILASAVTIEQFPGADYAPAIMWTLHVPLFKSFVQGTGISPLEVLIVLVMVCWVMKAAVTHSPILPRSPLALCMGVFLLVVLIFLGVGLARHGQIKIALWEVRPWFYMGAAYLLGTSLLSTGKAVRALLWTMVLGSGFKAVQGVVSFLAVRDRHPRPQAVLAHEESFFLGMLLILTLGLWVFGLRGRLRTVATCLAPVVLLADAFNDRRTAWAVLGVGAIMLLLVGYRCLPGRRRVLRWVALALLVASAVYFPAFWNHGGTLGQPATAVRSEIHPSARDRESNQYRDIEDADLVLNIRARDSLGSGFGIPIDYAIPIVNLDNIDSDIAFIPHNGVLWVWMRTGIVGEVLLWLLIGAAIIRGADLAKCTSGEVALLGTLAVSAVGAYVVIGLEDMGFFWFRIALFVGCLLGAVESQLRSVSREKFEVQV